MCAPRDHMARAIELARQGRGYVEPNPMVGCVIVADTQRVGEGWHRQFGGPHAEVEALRMAGPRSRGATLYVTLEPCCHHGKTPPCTDAIIEAGVQRVVVAQEDPFPEVRGQGIARLRQAGIEVEVGLLHDEALKLNAAYRRLIEQQRPWVIAKWAMTLDGKIASRTGSSRWISSAASRRRVHQLRGVMDAIIVGSQTARQDDPLLTARPPGPRTPVRIVLDSRASLRLDSQLVQTIAKAPTWIVTGPEVDSSHVRRLEHRGCTVLVSDQPDYQQRLRWLLNLLGQRRMTNVLVEGGGQLLGTLFDARVIDEVHVFIAPKIVGGRDAVAAVAGIGASIIPENSSLVDPVVEILEQDVYISGQLRYA